MSDKFWTDARVTELRELFAAGLSGGKIAREMHAPTRNVIIGKLTRLGLVRARAAPVRRQCTTIERKGDGRYRARSYPPQPLNSMAAARALGESHAKADQGLASAVAYRVRREQNGAEKPKPLPFSPRVVEHPAGQRCTLLELTNWTCRWPVTDDHPFEFCAGPADLAAGVVYCARHARIATQPPSGPRRGRPPAIPFRFNGCV